MSDIIMNNSRNSEQEDSKGVRNIRFKLLMKDGFEVNTIEELLVHFDLGEVLKCLDNGTLVKWLKDRFEDEIAEVVESVDKSNPSFEEEVCKAFGIDYDKHIMKDKVIKNRVEMLKTAGFGEFEKDIDSIAFTQDELYDLLLAEKEIIYLFGEKYSIPMNRRNVKYIGINNPEIIVSSRSKVDWAAKSISFENTHFDDKYSLIEDSEVNTSSSTSIAKSPHIPGKRLLFLQRPASVSQRALWKKENGQIVRISDDTCGDVIDFVETDKFIIYCATALGGGSKFYKYNKKEKTNSIIFCSAESISTALSPNEYSIELDETLLDYCIYDKTDDYDRKHRTDHVLLPLSDGIVFFIAYNCANPRSERIDCLMKIDFDGKAQTVIDDHVKFSRNLIFTKDDYVWYIKDTNRICFYSCRDSRSFTFGSEIAFPVRLENCIISCQTKYGGEFKKYYDGTDVE